MFQKTRIRLTIVNSLVFILLIGILGSIIYSYTYKRIYNEVDRSIKMMAQYREKLDVKIPPRKRMENIQIGDPRVTRITWNGKIVKIEGDNRKFRSIFEENLEKFSPEKIGSYKISKYKDDILEHFRFKRWRNSSNRARYNSGRRNVKYFIFNPRYRL